MPEKVQGNKCIYFRYYGGTSQESRSAVKSSVDDFYKKVGNNINFLRGTKIFVADKYGDIDANSPLTAHMKKYGDENYAYTHGCTVFPEMNSGKKEIIIRTKEYQFPYSVFRKSLKPNVLQQSVMHEIGHVFDDYFGSKNERLLNHVKNIKNPNKLTNIEKTVLSDYSRHKDLSDNQDFKDAWKKDVENLGKNKDKYEKFKSGWTTEYYAANEIDITDGVTTDEIEKADKARSEIFAQLFGYAFGKDDGYKKVITETYPNTYKVVKNYIQKYLGVDFNISHAL